MDIKVEFSQSYDAVTKDELTERTDRLRRDGYRLAQISATNKGRLNLIYSFDKDYELRNLCLEIDKDEEIESISGIYSYAFLYENELKDLFGVKINNMNIDFKGYLYKTSVKTPFRVD